MKWTNKGHEFDELGEKLKTIKAIYLFGAGLDGQTAYKQFSDKILIKGFIDNDIKKQSEDLFGLRVFSPEEIVLLADEAIVITTDPSSTKEITVQLENMGFINNVNVFSMHLFFPVWSMYVLDELFLWAVSFLPSTICNLNCRHCLNFTPYIKHHETRSIEELRASVDLLFGRIDSVLIFHVSGGEPFLYLNLPELFEYISVHHSNKIGRLETSTNGTVIPSDQLCEILRDCCISVIVDDYRESIPKYKSNFDKLIRKLELYNISYKIQKVDSWIDLAPFEANNSSWNDEQLQRHFDDCRVLLKEYRDGKIYLCNYASYASVAGIIRKSDEYIDLNLLTDIDRKQLLEFGLGYSHKGYTEFCKQCLGYHNNTKSVPVAEQL